MITIKDLRSKIKCRQQDAKVLYNSKRYEGAVYLAGYAIELAIKKRICNALKWTGFPEKKKEFDNLVSFRTHKLDVLLHLSGVEEKMKTKFLTEWSIVNRWDPEMRYRTGIIIKRKEAKDMLDASQIIINNL